MALAFLFAGSAQRDSLVEGDVVADDGGFADYGAHAMVDEEAAADFRAGMNFDSGEQARDLRREVWREAHVRAATASG